MEATEKEMRNLQRLIENTLNLIADCPIKGNDAYAVAEIMQWLTNFRTSVLTQLDSLPSQGISKEGTTVDAEAVSAVAKA